MDQIHPDRCHRGRTSTCFIKSSTSNIVFRYRLYLQGVNIHSYRIKTLELITKNCHSWYMHVRRIPVLIWCISIYRDILDKWVKYKYMLWLYLFIYFSPICLQTRHLDRFWCTMAHKMWNHASVGQKIRWELSVKLQKCHNMAINGKNHNKRKPKYCLSE